MEKEIRKSAQEFLSFLNASPVSFIAVENTVKILKDNGFERLDEGKTWALNKGGKYFVERGGLAVIAFVAGTGKLEDHGFRIIGAHADSPGFKIKPNPAIEANGYVKFNVETYGGPILSTWFDRPLSVAGRIIVRGKNPLQPIEKTVNLKKPLLVIPNLAIHFNREINEGYKYNKQVDMLPFLGFIKEEINKEDRLMNLICSEAKVKPEDVLDFELFLYEYDKGVLFGEEEEFISCGRLDDLWMVHAGLKALLSSGDNKATKMLCVFDAEEVGSRTKNGADSDFLGGIIDRITMSLSDVYDAFYISLSKSVFVSADLAHAVHPNLADKHDPVNRPLLGKGPVIKYSGNQRYATTAKTASIFMEACKKVEVPYQVFTNRSDLPGGSTIGPGLSSNLSIDTVDMGAPIFGMHSVRETGAVIDNIYTELAFKAFYEM